MWLIIGYGNVLRSDDGFGLRVACDLKARNISHLSNIIATPQLLPELAEPVSRADGVIFVDASAQLAPGELECTALAEQSHCPEGQASSFSHHLTPLDLLRSAQALYGRAPQGWLYTVGGGTFDLADDLSPQAKARIPEVVRLITEKIETAGAQPFN